MPSASFYIGSYSIPSPWAGAPGAHGAGICRAELDLATGDIVFGPRTSETNPSFLVRDRSASLLWAITEPEFGGDLACFREDAAGTLGFVGRSATGADAPCHLALDAERRLAFVAHYHGGSVATLALAAGGAPERSVALALPPTRVRGQDRGHVVARPHASLLLASGEVLVADAGRDAVLLYRPHRDGAAAGLELVDALPLRENTGPRHMAHRLGDAAVYVSNQNAGGISIVARTLTDAGPRLEWRGSVAAAGLGRHKPVPSEIALHPTAAVVYLANRTDDSLSVFSVESEDGALAARGCVDVMGRNPRHFAVSPDGNYLIAANQDSDELTVFRIDDGGRTLTWTGRRHPIATPTAICF